MNAQPTISDAVCDRLIDIGNGMRPVRMNKQMAAAIIVAAATLEGEARRKLARDNAELQARTDRQASVPDGISAETDC